MNHSRVSLSSRSSFALIIMATALWPCVCQHGACQRPEHNASHLHPAF